MRIDGELVNGIAYERLRGKLHAAEIQANPQIDAQADAARVHAELAALLRSGSLEDAQSDEIRREPHLREQSIQQRTGYLEHTQQPRFTLEELRRQAGRFASGKNTASDISELYDFAGVGRAERSRASSPERPRDASLSLYFKHREAARNSADSTVAGPSKPPEPVLDLTPLIEARSSPLKRQPEIIDPTLHAAKRIGRSEREHALADTYNFEDDCLDLSALPPSKPEDEMMDFGFVETEEYSPRRTPSPDTTHFSAADRMRSPAPSRSVEPEPPPAERMANLLSMAPWLNEHEHWQELLNSYDHAVYELPGSERASAVMQLAAVIGEVRDANLAARLQADFARLFGNAHDSHSLFRLQ